MSTNITQYSGCCIDMGLDKNNHGPHGRSQLPVQDWVTCADDWQLLIGHGTQSILRVVLHILRALAIVTSVTGK